MSISQLGPGENPPEDINVVIEIPQRGEPVKYEVDKNTGLLSVDRFMATSMHYPTNYGYIPSTLSDDGDPADVLVVAPMPLLSGSVIRCRPVGILNMTDEAGNDAKILAVPIDKLTQMYKNIKTHEDLPPSVTLSIEHFFEHYKDLEEGKWVKINGWGGPVEAHKEIISSIANHKK